MPERFDSQELTETWVGVYQQPSTPPSLSWRFATVMHNMALRAGMPHVRPGVRRINTSLLGSPGDRTIYGLGVWRGTTQPEDLLLAAAGDLLQSLPQSGGPPTTLTNSYPTGFRASPTGARTVFTQLGGQAFIVNGVDENVKFNGTDVTRMGIVAPASLASPTLSAGAITGTRQYFASLVSDVAHKSAESAGTPALSVTLTAQQGSFVAPAVPSSDPQVDRWNLYATSTTDPSTFFRVNDSAQTLATAIVDNLTDAELVAGVAGDRIANAVPPGTFRLLAEHQGRLVGSTAEDPNSIVWSDLGLDLGGVFFKPEAWPAVNRLPFGERGGTKITALVSFFEWILVFNDFGVWSIRGTLADSSSRVVSPLQVAGDGRGTGVSDIGNIAIAENKVYYAAKNGIYLIRREIISGDVPDLSIELISTNVDELYRRFDFDQGGVALYDRDQRRYIFWGTGKGVIS